MRFQWGYASSSRFRRCASAFVPALQPSDSRTDTDPKAFGRLAPQCPLDLHRIVTGSQVTSRLSHALWEAVMEAFARRFRGRGEKTNGGFPRSLPPAARTPLSGPIERRCRQATAQLDEDLQTFCAEIGKVQEHTRYVAAWACQASDPSTGDRIAFKINRDRGDILCGPSRRLYRGRSSSDDGIHGSVHQIRCESWQARSRLHLASRMTSSVSKTLGR